MKILKVKLLKLPWQPFIHGNEIWMLLCETSIHGSLRGSMPPTPCGNQVKDPLIRPYLFFVGGGAGGIGVCGSLRFLSNKVGWFHVCF